MLAHLEEQNNKTEIEIQTRDIPEDVKYGTIRK
jgi:hypothetical protein